MNMKQYEYEFETILSYLAGDPAFPLTPTCMKECDSYK